LTPLVSVIVPVFNDLARLGLCLDALALQTWPASKMQIIVCDNGSDSSVADKLEKWPDVLTVREARPGSYAARNAAISLATGEIYAFTDSDCIPDADWIEQGVGTLEKSGGRGFVGGSVRVFPRDAALPNYIEQYEMIWAFDMARYMKRGFCGAGNLFVSADVFQEVGLFDANLRSNGDREWGERASALGVRGVYCEAAVVAHPARTRMRDIQRKAARVVGGRHTRGTRRRLSKELLYSVVPRVDRMIRVFKKGRSHALRYRLNAALVAMFVEYFRAWEGIRLRLGGEPGR
jgi:glycosyltransferase involved in cell wall biosynthesis